MPGFGGIEIMMATALGLEGAFIHYGRTFKTLRCCRSSVPVSQVSRDTAAAVDSNRMRMSGVIGW
jgi:hypothetical protein